MTVPLSDDNFTFLRTILKRMDDLRLFSLNPALQMNAKTRAQKLKRARELIIQYPFEDVARSLYNTYCKDSKEKISLPLGWYEFVSDWKCLPTTKSPRNIPKSDIGWWNNLIRHL